MRTWTQTQLTCLTWADGSLDGSGDAVGAVLCDGLNGQLVLTHGGRLHYGDSLQGRGRLGALDDATGAAYRGDGGDRLHFDWEEDTDVSEGSRGRKSAERKVCEQKNKNSVMRVSFIYERSKCGGFSAPSLLTSSHYSASENWCYKNKPSTDCTNNTMNGGLWNEQWCQLSKLISLLLNYKHENMNRKLNVAVSGIFRPRL